MLYFTLLVCVCVRKDEGNDEKKPTHCGDATCPACVVAGDYVFLAHHAGRFDKRDITHQMRAAFESAKKTLASAGATLNDMAQIIFYIKSLDDFQGARAVFFECFDKDNFPARMTSKTEFLNDECLCMIDEVAYKPD